jgi:hypothetical protein
MGDSAVKVIDVRREVRERVQFALRRSLLQAKELDSRKSKALKKPKALHRSTVRFLSYGTNIDVVVFRRSGTVPSGVGLARVSKP